jgi:heme-degrading monooxygenase HmoA
MYTCLWEFVVDAGARAEFERHYGADGTWVRLFRRAPGFVETRLLIDRADPGRYVTVDRWQSEEAYRAFRDSHAAQYAELDAECGKLTRAETFLGAYLEMAPEAPSPSISARASRRRPR